MNPAPTYYKVLGKHGEAVNGGSGNWPLPRDGKPGRWKSLSGDLIPCRHALHACMENQLVRWLGPTIWQLEFSGKVHTDENKCWGRRARLIRCIETWNETTARLFATDCAEWALLEQRAAGREPDARSWDAVKAARAFANGQIDEGGLSAAGNAAWSAAESAAGSAAWSAAESAAGSAAGSAAWSAAQSAAESAAWSAAESAAGSGAGSAAWSAAESAAWSAAWSAAGRWQTTRLMMYLRGEVLPPVDEAESTT